MYMFNNEYILHYFYYWFIFAVLGNKLRALHMLGKHSNTECYIPSQCVTFFGSTKYWTQDLKVKMLLAKAVKKKKDKCHTSKRNLLYHMIHNLLHFLLIELQSVVWDELYTEVSPATGIDRVSLLIIVFPPLLLLLLSSCSSSSSPSSPPPRPLSLPL